MHGHRVLVIDDDSDFVELITYLFRRAGAIVESARTAEESLRRVRQRPPDLVLLDVMMPEADGWQVCASIRELCGVPIMLLTSLSGAENVARGLDQGADDFVTKSTSHRVLLARARALLRRVDVATQRNRWLSHYPEKETQPAAQPA